MKRRELVKLSALAAATLSGCMSLNRGAAISSREPVHYPPALKFGDTVCCVSPATVIQDTALIEMTRSALESYGLRVVIGKHALDRNGYLAGTDEHRAQDINDAFSNPHVQAIFALRGGWGSNRILPYLDFDLIRTSPKVFMGFSDITTLLNAFYHKAGLVTFHGSGSFSSWNDYRLSYLSPLLFAGQTVLYRGEDTGGKTAIEKTQVMDDQVVHTITPGVAEGRLVGGNMSVWLSLSGTDYLPDPRGKILFFEDVNEPLYRIDRYLSTLKLNGTLDKIAGIIFGQFRKPADEQEQEMDAQAFTLVDVISDYVRPLNIPCYLGAQIGHIRHSQIWPVGARVRMDAAAGTLQLLEPAVTV